MTAAACNLCGNAVDGSQPLYSSSGGLRAAYRVFCSTCGTYDISEMMDRNAKSLPAKDRYRLSAITRAASEDERPIELTTDVVDELLRTTRQPSPVEQVDLLLDYLDRHTSPGEPAELLMERDYAIARAPGPTGLQFIVDSMVKDRLIERTDESARPHYRIAMAGYERIKRQQDTRASGGRKTKEMKLPYVVLKNIGDGSKVGDVVDASTFRNLKLLEDQGSIRPATAGEVADWQKSHPSTPTASTAESATKEFEGWGPPLKELGAGGQGKVYLVRHPEAATRRRELVERIALDIREVSSEHPPEPRQSAATDLAISLQAWLAIETEGLGALKEFQMPASGAEHDKALGRLEAEIKALQKLTHPAVIRLLDGNAKQGFIVTEYHPDGTLAALLERSPERFKGNLGATLFMARPLVEAVVAIHAAGAVHRDIKPENIFVRERRLILGDFGIVIFQDAAGERLTETFERRAKGSRDWMAPWAYSGKRITLEEIDSTFDVFSLGKVLWVMLSGDPILPFWYFDRDDHNLERRFPDDPHMRLANALLSKCVVEHKKDCASSAELLKLIDEALVVIRADADVLDTATKRSCRVCGKGKYEADEKLGHLDLSGKPLMAMTFICDACGHVQMFRAPGRKLGPAWRS